MKAHETTPPPVERTWMIELTQEEFERIFYLAYKHEGGPLMPIVGRIHESIPLEVAHSAARRFGLTLGSDYGAFRTSRIPNTRRRHG